MPKSPKVYTNHGQNSRVKPPESIEEAEKTCTALAYELVMQRLRDGTATSQETTHFLKLSSQREKNENELAKARIEKEKAEALKKQDERNDLYEKALEAFRGYSGNLNNKEEDWDE